MGLLAAVYFDKELPLLPETTLLGQFQRRLTTPSEQRFQPVNANFGILPELVGIDRSLKKQEYAKRSLADLDHWIMTNLK